MLNRFERMTRTENDVLRITRNAMLLAGMIAIGGAALAQNTIPDAQVEANVLKALAGAPELASESITTHTVYGVVTLSGSVSNEQARTKAENLAANARGVTKVVDELSLGASAITNQGPGPMSSAPPSAQPGAQPLVLQSDGTYAPATAANAPAPGSVPATAAQRNNPDADQQLDLQTEQQQTQNPQPQDGAAQPQYPSQPQYPQQQGSNVPPPNYPQGFPQYPQQPYGRQPMNPQYAQQPGMAPVPGGQVGGEHVVIPPGALLRVRIDRFLATDKTPAGTTFSGIISNDVVAGGEVAIPRGATVQGTVIQSVKSGALKGRGEMSLQLTSVTLGGKTYPLVSDVWAHDGADKTVETINRTAGLGGFGAIVGAIAGGGAGAAIGGGIGAAAGLGSSAASRTGQVYIPAESMLIFHTAQETPVVTLSEQEMQRLSYGVPGGGDQRAVRRPYAYPPGYPAYPPGYYPYGYPHQ
jgi:hypothetical protein